MQLKVEHLKTVVDSKEETPWDLRPMVPKTTGLSVGDNSIRGLESVVAVERKSLEDFGESCGSERERFQRELDILRGWPNHNGCGDVGGYVRDGLH